MTRTWIGVSPFLLLLAHLSTPQTTAASPAPHRDSICLSEILISTPQPYDPAQIADAKKKADIARETIRQGARFEDIAKKYSDGPSAPDGGALGTFKRGQLGKQIEDKAFVMKAGDVSDVIRTKQGFVVLQVTECSPATTGAGEPRTIEILSDTQGVDFGPYLKDVLAGIRSNWYRLIPESASRKKGKLAIEFAITKEGKITVMRLVATSGDTILDRAAWGGITACNPFKPLPDKFTGQYLALRMRFYYNPDKSDMKAGDN